MILGALSIPAPHSFGLNNGNPATQSMKLGAAGTISQQYVFDALNRLQSVVDGSFGTQAYAYDRWGNRAMVTESVEAPGYPVSPATVANASEVAAKFPGNQGRW